MASTPWTDCQGFHRRDFLRIGSAGLFGFGLADLLRAEAQAATTVRSKASAKSVIMVWLSGGPSHLDLWDPKPDAPDNIRGEFQSIDTKAAGIRICEHLPKMAALMNRCALVRSMHHHTPDHGIGTNYVTAGNKPGPMQYPSLGSLAAKLLPCDPAVPPFVRFNRIGVGAGYLGSAYNPFEADSGSGGRPQPLNARSGLRGISLPQGFTLEDLDQRNKLLEAFDETFKSLDQSDLATALDRYHQQALDILRSDKTKKAFDLSGEPAALVNRYGFAGRSALTARRLVEAGVRFVMFSMGQWDTHANNFRTLRTQLLPQLDQLLSSLITDLADRGMLDSTIVYCVGEFGRTPKINRQAGRDHWARAIGALLAGGGIKGGHVHGATDKSGMAPSSEPCLPDDIAATIFHCLGLDPHQELKTQAGRPMQLFPQGKVLEGLIG